MMKEYNRIIFLLLLILIVGIPLLYFTRIFFTEEISLFLTSIIFLIFSFTFFRILGDYISKLEIEKSREIGNQVKIFGYVLSILISLSIFRPISSALLTIGTIGGIIFGLTLQPVLGNFFAGILIMTTRFIEVGKKIRILSSSIPYSITPLPSYKYFSVENADVGYKGEVISVDWFFSLIKCDDGKIVKIPNLVLLNSAVLEYDEEEFIYSIRVEFPLNLRRGWTLKKVIENVKKIMKEYILVDGPYFNEQSDKNYVFIRAKIRAKNKNWEEEKSELLLKLLELKRRIEKT